MKKAVIILSLIFPLLGSGTKNNIDVWYFGTIVRVRQAATTLEASRAVCR